MKTAWVFPVSRVWRPYEHPRAHPSFFKKLAYSDKLGKLQLGKGSSPVSRPTNHTRRYIHSSFFQKYTWGILWNLHLVHNTIWFSVSTQNVRISSPQLCEFFFSPSVLSKCWLAILPENRSYKDFGWSFPHFCPLQTAFHIIRAECLRTVPLSENNSRDLLSGCCCWDHPLEEMATTR